MPKISVVSCVNDFDKYNCCVGSSFKQEQKNATGELIPIDNTSNTLSASEALNQGLKKATGEIIVFCHQDVKFPQGWIEKLLEQIAIVERTHKNWGVLGTFGVAKNGMFAGHIIDPSGHFHCLPLPAEVQSLDEHCLIIRRDSGLAFDEELGKFHLYGADICLQAMSRGLTNFAIDACVRHLSSGRINTDFHEAVSRLYEKWRYKNPPLPVIETTCKMLRLRSGLKGFIAYRVARFKRKRKRKKIQRLIKVGCEYTKLRHDSI